jgi:hypothetical protein
VAEVEAAPSGSCTDVESVTGAPPGEVTDEVAWLERLGATVVERYDGHDGHTVMRDPESNEFCVEPGPVGR